MTRFRFLFNFLALNILAIAVLPLASVTSAQKIAGQWSVTLRPEASQADTEHAIDFRLALQQSDDATWSAFLINGTERIRVPSVVVDSHRLQLEMDHYDSVLTLQWEQESPKKVDRMTGTWRKRRSADRWVKMVCKAVAYQGTSTLYPATTHFDGTWRVKFEKSDDPAVGIFKMDPTTRRIDGTFLTTTGDYRFLSGSAFSSSQPSIDSMRLSCFDGAHAFQFVAKIDGQDQLNGKFWSSDSWEETWTANRDANAKLPDDFAQTKSIPSQKLKTLVFPDLNGKPTSVGDQKFAAPVRMVHIFGSWCPNCHDAGQYLSELKTKYGDKISVVGLAFELTGEFKRDVAQVKKYLQRHDLDHPVLIAGLSDKSEASQAVPILDRVRSYPTTLFADSGGNVIAVHTGFTGPATGQSYTALKSKFEATIEKILADHQLSLVQQKTATPPPVAQSQQAEKATAAAKPINDWPLFRGDPESTGVARSSLPEDLEILWQYKVPGSNSAFKSTAVIVRNQSNKKETAYIADLDGKIFSFDLATGKKNWEYQAGISIEASPAYKDGKIFIGDIDGNFLCLDEAGKLVWKKEFETAFIGSANFFGKGVLLGGENAKLYFLDRKDGSKIWEFEASDQIQSSITVGDGKAFLAGCDGRFRLIDLKTGTESGSVEMGSPTCSTPAVSGGKAVVGTEQAEFICIDLKKVSAAWGFADEDGPASIRGAAAVKGNQVVFGARNRQVYSIDLKTGKQQWTRTLKGKIDSSPVIVGDRVFVGGGDGRLYILSLEDGEELWVKQLKGPLISSPAVGFEKLVIATDRGVVYCLGKKK